MREAPRHRFLPGRKSTAAYNRQSVFRTENHRRDARFFVRLSRGHSCSITDDLPFSHHRQAYVREFSDVSLTYRSSFRDDGVDFQVKKIGVTASHSRLYTGVALQQAVQTNSHHSSDFSLRGLRSYSQRV